MPHKRNPILSENLSGLARLLRGYSISALENIPLWHERDISHSSVERVIAPDGCIVADFMLHRFARLVEQMRVYPEQMRENLEKLGGVIYSQAVLLALARKGLVSADILKTYTMGAVGLALSHFNLWDSAIASGEMVTIAEDDAIFNRNFDSLAEAVIKTLPADWNMIVWGFNFDLFLCFDILPGVSTCSCAIRAGPLAPGHRGVPESIALPARIPITPSARKARRRCAANASRCGRGYYRFPWACGWRRSRRTIGPSE